MYNTSLSLAIESWILYTIGICLILSRIVSRRITLGSFSNLQSDDWIMVFIIIPLSGTCVCANQVSLHGIKRTSLEHPDNLSPGETEGAILGRKARFALEEFQLVDTWLVKACLLILYKRIFPDRRHHLFIHLVAAYCLLAFFLIQVLLLLWCLPVEDYWVLAPKNTQCSSYHSHHITTLTLNLTTSLLVLIIPVPLIPTPRKLLLAILFVLGTLVLISSILSRYHGLTDSSSPTYLYWYVAEAAVSIYFANLPFLNQLLTHPISHRLSRLELHSRSHSSNPSLRQWPRALKPTCTINTSAGRLNSTASTLVASNAEDGWSEGSPTSSTHMTPVHKLRPADPPSELVGYWSRRPSTVSIDKVMPPSTRRSSTVDTEKGISFSRPTSSRWPSTLDTETGVHQPQPLSSRCPSIFDVEEGPLLTQPSRTTNPASEITGYWTRRWSPVDVEEEELPPPGTAS
ncbi:hypothetical protein K469DRAFT_747361 [Zopfia rhizophila CBS 207.26]|uniref:Rhodopsin domain-containing protein n=1 Tax=Zopfia rhizophila CBS 207.26 TaxID=1314779 RepID=A0A6A6EH05_9PEZI|nr:hypothetical protein K469DRAFT_747361 [Zopfia rhizophila CBS 207.26]